MYTEIGELLEQLERRKASDGFGLVDVNEPGRDYNPLLTSHLERCVRLDYYGKIHYTRAWHKGLKAAYMAENRENIDFVVRLALEIEGILPKDAGNFNMKESNFRPYILRRKDVTIYHNPAFILNDTSCRVEVPFNERPISVGVYSRLPMDFYTLKDIIKTIIILGQLIPNGLEPVSSERRQIPRRLL